ncbi:PREDICTED: putative pectinesterase 10 [Tarenaya hassleriana]|uniref:putative pectinesterase 10 n=1 Tax=Tarenaya hassleriana TaxID=28532 RepID=UPI0008FD3420|nr:PREDICTED: putative pectinesterase 10 [Tarenaya hassleriana]
MGLQDTLWDASGRHYFRNCYISGCIDFIWGYGQSIYEGCHLHVELEPVPEKESGCITAQGRQWESEENGFVFKGCTMSGGKALLGRAYGPYSRVIFYQCDLSDSVLPLGWDSWDRKGQE